MIVALAIWLVAITAASGYGRLFLPRDSDREGAEYDLTRIYAGLLVLSTLLLAAAVFASLTPLVGIFAALPGIVIYWRNRGSRGQIRYYSAIFAVVALFVSTREVDFYDTALYHQQAVKWLADHGLVRGLALVHFRFGYLSSWFALAAPLNHGIAEGRAGIVGGLPFGLAVVLALQIVRGLRERRFALTTWAVFGSLLSAVAILWHLDTSLGTDMMVWLLPMAALTILNDTNATEADRLGRATAISAMACLIKLTAVPALVYCFAILSWRFARVPEDRRKLAAFAGLALGVLSVLLAANVIVSGCPLFPSPLGCVSKNWSVGVEAARTIQVEAEQFARMPRHNEIFPLTALAALASALLAATIRTGYARHILGVAWVGIAFTLVVAPVSRYGLGYFLLPIAALTASALSRVIVAAGVRMDRFGGWARASALVAATAVIAAPIFVATTQGGRPLLYPRRIAAGTGDPIHVVNRVMDARGVLTLRAEKHGELTVWVPASSDQCWDAPLPCTPYMTRDDVRLRLKGNLGAGFLRP